MTPKLLNIAKKYNWWTLDKSNLSEESLVSYILKYGDENELSYVNNNFLNIVKKCIKNIEKDILFPVKRKKILRLILNLKIKNQK